MSLKSHPTRAFLVPFVILSAALTVALWRLLGWAPVLSYLVAVNAVAPLLWAWDKFQATRGGWRVPELGLHLMAALGATPASFAAMLVLRHKIRKPLFWGLYVVLFVAQLAVCVYWAEPLGLR